MIPIIFLLNPHYWASNNTPMAVGLADYKQRLLQMKQQLLNQYKQVEASLSALEK